MIIVIDDERTFDFNDVTYFRDGQTAMVWFALRCSGASHLPEGALEPISEIWFDHDLGPKSNFDALAVARFVALMKAFDLGDIKDASIYVHSQNPVGAEQIMNAFYSGDAVRVSLPPLKG